MFFFFRKLVKMSLNIKKVKKIVKKVKILKTSKISSDNNIKTCRSLKPWNYNTNRSEKEKKIEIE